MDDHDPANMILHRPANMAGVATGGTPAPTLFPDRYVVELVGAYWLVASTGNGDIVARYLADEGGEARAREFTALLNRSRRA